MGYKTMYHKPEVGDEMLDHLLFSVNGKRMRKIQD